MDTFEKYYFLAIRYLSFRNRSEKEVRDYLLKKLLDNSSRHSGKRSESRINSEDIDSGVAEAPQNDYMEIIEQVIESLKRDKFVNDREFARAWVRSRLAGRPKSKRVLRMELKEKGIAESIIEEVFADEELDVNDREIARSLAQKQMRKYKSLDRQQIYQKLGAFLSRRGFDFSTIRSIIDEMLSKKV